jgi:hypothetical protein
MGTELSKEDVALLESVAGRIVRMRMAVPAVFFLESAKPLSFLGSQALIFMEPFVKAFLTLPQYDRFARLLEDRGNVERLIQLIERMDQEQEQREKEARRAARRKKAEGRLQAWRWWRK